MKSILFGLLALTVATTSAYAAEENEVAVGISGVFVPGGFRADTEAYVVVNGVFQNGCYKWSRAEKTTRDSFNHEIRSMAKVTPGMCIMVLVPFQKEVRLGQLPAGRHTLRFINGDGTYLEKTLVIE